VVVVISRPTTLDLPCWYVTCLPECFQVKKWHSELRNVKNPEADLQKLSILFRSYYLRRHTEMLQHLVALCLGDGNALLKYIIVCFKSGLHCATFA
jgi:hypothetical protein